ncbi:dynamin family protein [Gallibacterium anatis]|uniref:Dynamin family protein n=1 Tax=Gallibacterium anatis TaxID=750 RepID=A0A930UYE2_9PAST|nr:dynamin family protein [Gallibacterium anatis]
MIAFIKVSEEIFNGGNYSVEFRGVENDWLDVQAEIKRAQQDGDIEIQASWQEEEDSANRLNDIKKLVKEAEQNPLFAEAIKEKDIQEKLSKAFSNDFDVYVAATMSAGKSTFINSLVGSELLPAANEATTAIIAEITDNKELPKGKFKGQRITKDGVIANSSEEVTLELLRNWNNTEIHNDTARIELEGDILGIAKRDNVRLVLSDTPGPNNSRDQDHQQVTINKISDTDKNPLICYLLNATQIGINDDKHTLTTIAETLNKGKVSKTMIVSYSY